MENIRPKHQKIRLGQGKVDSNFLLTSSNPNACRSSSFIMHQSCHMKMLTHLYKFHIATIISTPETTKIIKYIGQLPIPPKIRIFQWWKGEKSTFLFKTLGNEGLKATFTKNLITLASQCFKSSEQAHLKGDSETYNKIQLSKPSNLYSPYNVRKIVFLQENDSFLY